MNKLIFTGIYLFWLALYPAGLVLAQSGEELGNIPAKPNIAFQVVQLPWYYLLLMYLLLIVACVSAAGWYYVSRKKTREAYQAIAGQDLEKMITLLTQDLKAVEGLLQGEKHDASTSAALDFRFRKIKDNLANMSKYLGQELKDIGANE